MSETALGKAALREPTGTFWAITAHMARLQIKSVLIWGGVLGAYAAAIVASYLSFGDPEQMEQIMSAYPEGMLEAFGITDMSTIEGYLGGQIFNLIPLAIAFSPYSRFRARSPAPKSEARLTFSSETRSLAGNSS